MIRRAQTPSTTATMRGVGIIIALFVLLAAIVSFVVPLGEAPDELDHFLYVEYLVQTRQLPTMHPRFEDNYTVEANQPPLYYLVGAAATAVIDWEEESHRDWNPCFAVDSPFRATFYIHQTSEQFPWRGAALAFHIMRLLSVGISALTLFVTARIAQQITTASKRELGRLPLLATALLAFNPQFVFISASVNNDVPTALLGATIVLTAMQLLETPSNHRRWWQMGVLLALAALTKVGLFALWLLPAVVWLWRWGRDGWRNGTIGAAQNALRLGLPPLLLAGWWYGRNLRVYGDPLIWEVHLQAKSAYVARQTPLRWADLVEFVQVHFQTYWARFGWLNLAPPAGAYSFYLIIVAVGVLLCVLSLVQHRRWRPAQLLAQRHWWPPLLAIFATYIALLRYIQTINWSGYQGRLAFGAAAPIALVLAFGWMRLLGSGQHRVRLLSIVLLIVCGWTLSDSLRSRFVAGELYAQTLEGEAVCHAFGPWELEQLATAQTSYRPGERLDLNISGYGTAPREPQEIQLLGRDQQLIGAGLIQFEPQTDQHIVGHATLVIHDSAEPARALVTLNGTPLTAIKIAPTIPLAPTPQQIANANFSDQIMLFGLDQGITVDGMIHLTLYWQAVERPGADFTRFVHLLDANGDIVAQNDRPPSYPTGIWDAGEIVADEVVLPLPAGVEMIGVGWYRPTSFENLILSDGAIRYQLPLKLGD